nr:uncharacterized protein LOC106691001 isoform X2 [Halyomorpha halys]
MYLKSRFQKPMRETAYLYDFSPCPGVEMASEVDTSFSYRGRDDYRINVDWKINRTVDNLSAILDIKKCPTRALVDCEVYLKFPVNEICHAVRNELNYTRLLHSSEPPIQSCPLKGRYQLKDFPIVKEIPDIKKLLGFGFITDNKTLKCDFSLLSGNVVLLCVRMVGSFRLTRHNLEFET